MSTISAALGLGRRLTSPAHGWRRSAAARPRPAAMCTHIGPPTTPLLTPKESTFPWSSRPCASRITASRNARASARRRTPTAARPAFGEVQIEVVGAERGGRPGCECLHLVVIGRSVGGALGQPYLARDLRGSQPVQRKPASRTLRLSPRRILATSPRCFLPGSIKGSLPRHCRD